MRVIDEIRGHFAAISKNGALEIKTLPDAYTGYVIRIPEGIGVAVRVDNNLEVSERFNCCRLFTGPLGIDETRANYLILCSPFVEYRYEFASLCAEFVEPGENGSVRKELIERPYEWWSRWKNLIGNISKDYRVYDVIAEMLVLEAKRQEDSSAIWTSLRSGSHDIECTEESCEVKSTIKRSSATITISGQHQLDHEKPLWLYFCRMEQSLDGVSINEMKERLVASGCDERTIELSLQKLGYERGTNDRNKKYKILEKRKYVVDDDFPRIVNQSFKENKLPENIIRVEYTINLDGLSYTAW